QGRPLISGRHFIKRPGFRESGLALFLPRFPHGFELAFLALELVQDALFVKRDEAKSVSAKPETITLIVCIRNVLPAVTRTCRRRIHARQGTPLRMRGAWPRLHARFRRTSYSPTCPTGPTPTAPVLRLFLVPADQRLQ